MTIRQHLLQKQRRFFAGLFISGAVYAAFVVSSILSEDLGWINYSIIGVAGILASLACLKLLVRCPRCNGNIGARLGNLTSSPILWRKRARHCPFCGVELDSPNVG